MIKIDYNKYKYMKRIEKEQHILTTQSRCKIPANFWKKPLINTLEFHQFLRSINADAELKAELTKLKGKLNQSYKDFKLGRIKKFNCWWHFNYLKPSAYKYIDGMLELFSDKELARCR